jgi:hypothetical protein
MSRVKILRKIRNRLNCDKIAENKIKQMKDAHIAVFAIITQAVEVVRCHGHGGVGLVVLKFWCGGGVGRI